MTQHSNFVDSTYGVYPEMMVETKSLPICILKEKTLGNLFYCNRKHCPLTKCGFKGGDNEKLEVDSITGRVWTRYINPKIIRK